MKLPQDTETTKYLEWPQYDDMPLGVLLDHVAMYFPGVNPDNIVIDKCEIQVDCFGYDLYDSRDYRWYYVFENRS